MKIFVNLKLIFIIYIQCNLNQNSFVFRIILIKEYDITVNNINIF